MKKTIFTAVFCIAAVSCSQKSIFQGTFHDESINDDTLIAIATDQVTDAADTCAVVDGKFRFEFPASDTVSYSVCVTSTDRDKARELRYCRTTVFPSRGNVSVYLSKDSVSVTGGALNDALVGYQTASKAISAEISARRNALKEKFGDDKEGYDAAVSELRKESRTRRDELIRSVFIANADNALGVYLFSFRLANYMPLTEADAYMAAASDYVKNNPDIARDYRYLVNADKTAVGKMFTDFEGRTPDGKDVKLSDFVGKGNYVLLDFWASWCGFCIEEFPNIKKVYGKYADRGLTVVGVAISDGDNSATRKAMEKHGVTWNQIFVGDDNTPTRLYGVRGIPHIMIFNPDGTVLVRDLRGDAIMDTVSGLYD